MGMNSVVCEERTRQACSALLNRPEHKLQDNIFEKFYNDLPTLCYHAAVRILTLFALYVIRLIGKCCPPGHRVGPETSLQGVDATYVNKMDWRDLMYSLTMQWVRLGGWYVFSIDWRRQFVFLHTSVHYFVVLVHCVAQQRSGMVYTPRVLVSFLGAYPFVQAPLPHQNSTDSRQ